MARIPARKIEFIPAETQESAAVEVSKTAIEGTHSSCKKLLILIAIETCAKNHS